MHNFIRVILLKYDLSVFLVLFFLLQFLVLWVWTNLDKDIVTYINIMLLVPNMKYDVW